MQRLPNKTPTEVLRYSFDWTAKGIQGDPIASVGAELISGDVTIVDLEHTQEYFTTWILSGGTDGRRSEIMFWVTTVGGQRVEQLAFINVEDGIGF